MENHHYETIIIGGGISGLSCARRLHDAGRDFQLITEDVGGRIKCDEKTGIHLGAGLVLANYKNVLKYVEIRPTVSHKKEFICDTECHSVQQIVLSNLKHLPKLLILLFYVWRLSRRINSVRKRLPFESFKEVAESDPFLSYVFSTPAKEFICKHGLEELTEKYISPLMASGFYTEADEVNTYYYLGTMTPLFSKIYLPDFSGTIQKLTRGFEKDILLGRVTKVVRSGEIFTVESTQGIFIAKNIVFAAPEESLRGVYQLPKPYIQQQVHRFILRGQRKEEYRDKYLTFNPKYHDIFKLTEAQPGYDLISAKNEHPGFERYYDSYEIVTHFHWTPAVMIPSAPIDQKLGDNVYLASDYNGSLLEDTFLSGLYAANQILGVGTSK